MLRLETDEEGRPLSKWCVCCKSWITPAIRDYGTGERMRFGVHVDLQIECPSCDGAKLLNEEPIEEPETEE